jgi:hypothetical protein
VHEALTNSTTDVSRIEDSTTEKVPRVRTETIPASSTLSCPEIEDPIEHLESENAARVFEDEALSLSRKLLISCGVTVFVEFIFLQMGKIAGVIRAEEYPDRPESPSEKSYALSRAQVKVDL